jgi:hypothetical protein
MYSTCIYCNGSLGRNESLEQFPVGKRLAFDGATGRLWVICPGCASWNLSPLETRWEAIEEAERLFRSTKVRVATDNIGLAKLGDGTELVRIGKPPQLELATWRYGEQLRSRYRKYMTASNLTAATGSVSMLMIASPYMTPDIVTNMAIMIPANVAAPLAFGWSKRRVVNWYNRNIPVAVVRNDNGNQLRLTQQNVQDAALSRDGDGPWTLSIPHVSTAGAGTFAKMIGRKEQTSRVHDAELIHGQTAVTALATIMSRANRFGADRNGLERAIRTIQDAPNMDALLSGVGIQRPAQPRRLLVHPSRGIAYAPQEVRLALEMSLHAESERRAMEGELAELEQQWKDAEAIGKIADDMFLKDK